MLDKWVSGDAERISPEAPVPVVLEKNYHSNLGGCGNLAHNLKSLGNDVLLFSTVGSDAEGNEVIELLKRSNVPTKLKTNAPVTTSKTRITGNNGQHLIRLDKELVFNCKESRNDFLTNVDTGDIIVLSDYNKGAVTSDLTTTLSKLQCKTFVDPKKEASAYKNAFLVKPNAKEYKHWTGNDFEVETALQLIKDNNWEWLVVTDGAKGIHVINNHGDYKHFIEEVREVSDVSGAGDTVLAVIVHCFMQGLDIFECVETASYAGARVVERRGVTVIQPADLNKGIIFTNGCFDILHKGHIELLKFAKNQGRTLVVGINDDESVKRLKGDDRPINDLGIRMENLLALPFVDDVIPFTDDTPYELIKELAPDIIVKGGDYTFDTVIGNDLAEVVIFPTVEGYSTTNILDKINGN